MSERETLYWVHMDNQIIKVFDTENNIKLNEILKQVETMSSRLKTIIQSLMEVEIIE